MTYRNEQNTNILYKGNKIDTNRVSDPKVMLLYLSTAHNVADLDDLQNTYDRKGYAYTRFHNANHDGIVELMTYLEQSEKKCHHEHGYVCNTVNTLSTFDIR